MKHLTDWHRRFKQQGSWTAELRRYLLNIANLGNFSNILDVGCGTGALFPDFETADRTLIGLDIDLPSLVFAKELSQKPGLLCGDGYHLPIRSGLFDLVFCHYLLLWCKEPIAILKEMARVTRKGGMVMCFAEPDYLSRIDHPEVFRKLGRLQNNSLEFQGVNLMIGRQLPALFARCGLKYVHTGVMGGERMKQSQEDFDREWALIAHDLGGLVAEDEILSMREKALETWLAGESTLFVPTFYGYGTVQ